MSWSQLGIVIRPPSWASSHASLPLPLHLEGSRYRVFYASRDERNRSHVGWTDLDLEDPGKPLSECPGPALSPGSPGHFDHYGVYPSSLVRDEGQVLLYTIGWTPYPDPPLFTAAVGLAVSSNEGETFERTCLAPIMARGPHDPCLVTSPSVLREAERWRMYYVSGVRWEQPEEGPPESYYHVRYAESEDGFSWHREGRVCIDYEGEESNVARVCVRPLEAGYEAYFSKKPPHGPYTLGYARSLDGLRWERADGGLGVGQEGEDWGPAQAYPWVIEHEGRRVLFYNGEGFGREGIRLALEQ